MLLPLMSDRYLYRNSGHLVLHVTSRQGAQQGVTLKVYYLLINVCFVGVDRTHSIVDMAGNINLKAT